MKNEENYNLVLLRSFEPNDHYSFQHWSDRLAFTCKMLCIMPYGGIMGTANCTKSSYEVKQAQNASATVSVTNHLPQFHSK